MISAFLFGTRLALGTMLLVAGAAKLGSTVDFAATVDRYRVLPAALVPLVATLVPLLEVGCGALLLLGVAPRVAAPLAAGLLVAFAVAMAVNLVRGERFDCGCGGTDREISWWLVARNVVLSAAAVAVAALPSAVPAVTGIAVVITLVAMALTAQVVSGAAHLARVLGKPA
ncbi:hypothetical protein Lesp02_37450 [Lentzea sp. NBRC 105346]|uniref:MauE/DoxX family redox-associated membrane protein n=1 Tax=Lentzea sp. NBRC 105346 TaxID=3032205 RepID=UPI0024A36647|nr:MauE/DoxX family redox-associated membrane protein [Lentzea sp. NBRC 105346]GLZ31557.1 hypothetical protein Lesp02_37450 [Lentzea sp. NBRC 105346]